MKPKPSTCRFLDRLGNLGLAASLLLVLTPLGMRAVGDLSQAQARREFESSRAAARAASGAPQTQTSAEVSDPAPPSRPSSPVSAAAAEPSKAGKETPAPPARARPAEKPIGDRSEAGVPTRARPGRVEPARSAPAGPGSASPASGRSTSARSRPVEAARVRPAPEESRPAASAPAPLAPVSSAPARTARAAESPARPSRSASAPAAAAAGPARAAPAPSAPTRVRTVRSSSGHSGNARARPARARPARKPVRKAGAHSKWQPVELRIPSIGVNAIVVQANGNWKLVKGPGHDPKSALPGQPGNCIIAAHRNMWSATFAKLPRVKKGDRIFVSTPTQRYTYLVDYSQRVPVKNKAPLRHGKDSRLTLYTCLLPFDAQQRWVVQGRLQTSSVAAAPNRASEAQGS